MKLLERIKRALTEIVAPKPAGPPVAPKKPTNEIAGGSDRGWTVISGGPESSSFKPNDYSSFSS